MIKLINFGLSKIVDSSSQRMSSRVGIVIYMSHEMINLKHYKSNTVSWSLGCVLFELMTLKDPFSYHFNEYCKTICCKAIPTFPTEQYSYELIGTVQHMLTFDLFLTKVKALKQLPHVDRYLLKLQNQV
jgi:serine/threonine protein kinase